MDAMVLLNSTALSAFSDAKNSASLSSFNMSTMDVEEKKKKKFYFGIKLQF